MCYLLTFMYIFAFKIYSIIDSSILVFIGLTIYAIINTSYRKKIIKQCCSRYVIGIIIAIAIIIGWSVITTLINSSDDFSYIKTIIHLLITIMIGIELVAYFDYKEKKEKIINYIIVAFIVQSCLQWIFFIFPSFSKIFNIFRTESMIANNIKYSGYRGLAISSSGFFGLSSAYGLVTILYFTKYNTLFKNYIIKFAIFLLMFTGTFFAGRTGFVAVPFVFIMLFAKLIKNRKEIVTKINMKVIGSLIVCITIFCVIVGVTAKNEKFSDMYAYAFELFNNIFSGKGAITTSTEKLLEMYNIEMSPTTFMIGDGKYTIINDGKESYYRDTDVGYYRKILYFGIVGIIFSFILQFVLLGKQKKKWQKIAIVLFLSVLELKGEIIGISIIINSILILYANAIEKQIGEKKKEKEEENVQVNCINDYL